MARKLAKMPPRPPQRSPERDTLDKLLDGSVWRLERGVDFEGDPFAEQNRLRAAARRRGLGLTYRDLGDGVLVVQALPKRKPAASGRTAR